MDENGSKLDLPLEGLGWTITLPMEEWGLLITACTELVEALPGEQAEFLDRALRAALAGAQAMPPLVIPE